jgi:membrane fusion protein, copper/silver efflux system
MSQDKRASRIQVRLVLYTLKATIGLALIGAMVLYRAEVHRWFIPLIERLAPTVLRDKPEKVDPRASLKRADGEVSPKHTFSPAHKTLLRSALEGYEKIRVGLSRDQIEVIAEGCTQMEEALTTILGDASLSPRVRRRLSAWRSQSQTLRQGSSNHSQEVELTLSAASAEVARRALSELSREVFRVLEIDPQLQVGWRAFTCPMVDGFQKWLQRPESIENPYMGQRMLSCGAASDWSSSTQERERPNALESLSSSDIAYWTCAMHPTVKGSTEGTCPLCNMDLTPVSHASIESGALLIDPLRRQRIGLRLGTVRRRSVKRRVRAMGQVAFDESRVFDVSLRVNGWVERLRVRREGDIVKRGTPLLGVYSPEYISTQSELLASPKGSPLEALARQRLRALGVPRRDIDALKNKETPHQRLTLYAPQSGVVIDKRVNEGRYIRAGETLFKIVDLSRVWVMVELPEDELHAMRPGMKARVELPYLDDHKDQLERAGPLIGEVESIYPYMNTQGRFGHARVGLPNPHGRFKPGMFAEVILEETVEDLLSLPTEAVIHTGHTAFVFVDHGESILRPHKVELGGQYGDWTEIKSGLESGARVVTSGAFLIASESRIRAALSYWEEPGETAEHPHD